MYTVIRHKLTSLTLALAVGLVAALLALLLLGSSAVSAKEPALANLNPAPAMQQPVVLNVTIVFTDTSFQQVLNLNGGLAGEGVHVGSAACRGDNCNRKTGLDLSTGTTEIVFEYRFRRLLALDQEERRLIVAGTGTIATNGGKERFSFTATFEDNRDGTVFATYSASRADASFTIPRAPGTLAISGTP